MELFETNDHPISDLVQSFLEAAQALVGSSDPAVSEARPAELSYELDQVVSTYLEDHQLSPALFESIQQDVLNTLADQFSDQGEEGLADLPWDNGGDAGLNEVLAYLDQHLDGDFGSAAPVDDTFGSVDVLEPPGLWLG
jgi:hypothetical protein